MCSCLSERMHCDSGITFQSFLINRFEPRNFFLNFVLADVVCRVMCILLVLATAAVLVGAVVIVVVAVVAAAAVV